MTTTALYSVVAKTDNLVSVLMDIDTSDDYPRYAFTVWAHGDEFGRIVYYPTDPVGDNMWFKPAVTCGDMFQKGIMELPSIYTQIIDFIKCNAT